MKKRLMALLLSLLLLTGCSINGGMISANTRPTEYVPNAQGTVATLGDDDTSFGEEIEDSGIYDGLFDEITQNVAVEWVSGSKNTYKVDGTTITFTAISEDTVYQIFGEFIGNIVIDVGDEHKFELELCGFSLVSKDANPIRILSGDKVTIQAKKDTKNYVYDLRPAAEENTYAGAVHSEVDLEISGKGELSVVSENNNGIHTKDDLQVKNLTLSVACLDNALKGNDSVSVEGATTKLIASVGDCIKTVNSDISEKGNQRGNITIIGGSHKLYAACDGIDAAHDVLIQDEGTALNIYTDKYSNYSKEVTSTDSETNYIRFTSNKYHYSVKYYNGEDDYVWVNAAYHSKVSGGRTTYYYYSYPKMAEYSKQQFFVYESADQQGQEIEYLVMSDYLTPNSGCDTFALTSRGNQLSYTWTNYSTKIQEGGFGGGPGGFGGMGNGNTDKGDHSTKGIKASNEIVIRDGTISIKSYDDAIHANNDTTIENNASPLGNVTILGGNLTLYSNDDGLHADGLLSIQGGTVTVTNAYEGIEGTQVDISGGYISVNSKDDGINATTTTGTAIAISGGTVYIYCTGDGIDSNSRTADVGIVFTGGYTVVISNSGMNSALDTENGYTYSDGCVVAIMPQGGMSSETTHCDNFNSIGKSGKLSLKNGQYLVATIGNHSAIIQMPVSLSALVVVLGDKSASLQTATSSSQTLDSNGVAWQ